LWEQTAADREAYAREKIRQELVEKASDSSLRDPGLMAAKVPDSASWSCRPMPGTLRG
jgi:hypothetical protein